jgi:hypothetical protein
MNMGDMMREDFKMILGESGSTIIIENESGFITEVKGIKSRKHGREVFAFSDSIALSIGVTLVIKATMERWIVDEVEPIVESDVVVSVNVYAHKAGSSPKAAGMRSGPLTINAHNSQVTLQHGGQGNTQHVNISVKGELGRHIEDLKKLIADSALDDLDKEEAHAEVQRVAVLAEKPKTPDVLERMNGRLKSVTGIVQKSAVIAAQIAPVIEGIRRCVS